MVFKLWSSYITSLLTVWSRFPMYRKICWDCVWYSWCGWYFLREYWSTCVKWSVPSCICSCSLFYLSERVPQWDSAEHSESEGSRFKFHNCTWLCIGIQPCYEVSSDLWVVLETVLLLTSCEWGCLLVSD